MVNHTLDEYRQNRVRDCADYEAIRDAAIALIKVIYGESKRLIPDNDPEEKVNRLWVFNSILQATLDLVGDSFITDGDEGGVDAIEQLLQEKEDED